MSNARKRPPVKVVELVKNKLYVAVSRSTGEYFTGVHGRVVTLGRNNSQYQRYVVFSETPAPMPMTQLRGYFRSIISDNIPFDHTDLDLYTVDQVVECRFFTKIDFSKKYKDVSMEVLVDRLSR